VGYGVKSFGVIESDDVDVRVLEKKFRNMGEEINESSSGGFSWFICILIG